jgi:hypothetical protein
MEIRNVVAVAALVAAGLAIQGFILAEVVGRPLATAVGSLHRDAGADRPDGALDEPAVATEERTGTPVRDEQRTAAEEIAAVDGEPHGGEDRGARPGARPLDETERR